MLLITASFSDKVLIIGGHTTSISIFIYLKVVFPRKIVMQIHAHQTLQFGGSVSVILYTYSVLLSSFAHKIFIRNTRMHQLQGYLMATLLLIRTFN